MSARELFASGASQITGVVLDVICGCTNRNRFRPANTERDHHKHALIIAFSTLIFETNARSAGSGRPLTAGVMPENWGKSELRQCRAPQLLMVSCLQAPCNASELKRKTQVPGQMRVRVHKRKKQKISEGRDHRLKREMILSQSQPL
jgi:hypothetical protein